MFLESGGGQEPLQNVVNSSVYSHITGSTYRQCGWSSHSLIGMCFCMGTRVAMYVDAFIALVTRAVLLKYEDVLNMRVHLGWHCILGCLLLLLYNIGVPGN